MGNDNAKLEKVNTMFKYANPNMQEITRKLPDNKEVRIKRIYHVNRPDIDQPPPPEPILIKQQPMVLVKKQPEQIVVVKKPIRNLQQVIRIEQIPPRTALVVQTPPKTVMVQSPSVVVQTPSISRQIVVTPSVSNTRQFIVTPAIQPQTNNTIVVTPPVNQA